MLFKARSEERGEKLSGAFILPGEMYISANHAINLTHGFIHIVKG